MTSFGSKFKMSAPIRVIKADHFQSFLRERSHKDDSECSSKTRKRRASVESSDLSESKRFAGDNDGELAYPTFRKSRSRLTDTWTKTLRRKVGLRRSVRQKKQANRKDMYTNYALLFGNSFDYFRYVDTLNGINKDMDIMYYKQIAYNLQDHELHKKIDHEMKMRDGSMKMLAAAKHTPQQLEAAKALHTSNCRMVAYMEHLQQRNTETVAPNHLHTEGNQFPCKGKVSISEIRIPLMWKDSDHFKNKGNYKRFTVFCLVRIGTEVFETDLVSEVDRLTTDISFDDVITFEDIAHDYDCNLEVYAYEHHEDLTIASTQVKLKKRISDISNTVGRRLSGLSLKEPFDMQSLPGPKFELVAHTVLKLSDTDDKTSSLDLTINKELDIAHTLPLFGNFCCRFVAQPTCLVNETMSGFLYIQEDEDWVKYWCSLQNLKISCWNSQFEADVQDPLTMIPVTKESIISDTDPSEAERSHSFHIQNRAHNERWMMAAPTSGSLADWWDGLQQHLLDQVVWKHSCEKFMEIQSQKTQSSPYFQRDKRAGSLYDKTRVKRGVKSQMLERANTNPEDSPLTLAFNRFTKQTSQEDKSTALSRNNSCPK